MSTISEFAAKQNEYNNKIGVAIDGLVGDVNGLKDLIKKLQDSAGKVTPEDQALLDNLDARTKDVADKLSALDDLTPPVPPVHA